MTHACEPNCALPSNNQGADQPAGGFVLGAERRSSVLANHTVDSTVVCTKCYVKKSRAMFDATDLVRTRACACRVCVCV